ncbi:hypothetical protein MBLNU459_g4875t2 [Dothideomycetes sp. NU459]
MDNSHEASMRRIEEAMNRLNASISTFSKKSPATAQSNGRAQNEQSQHPKEASDLLADVKLDSEVGCDLVDVEQIRNRLWSTGKPLFDRGWDLDTTEYFPNITNLDLRRSLNSLHQLRSFLPEHPYNIQLYTQLSLAYITAGYPDLAIGSAYKALLLIDVINNEDEEYYEQTMTSLMQSISKEPLPRRCSIMDKHPDLQRDMFHTDCAKRDEDNFAVFPVNDQEVLVWVNENAAEYCMKGLELFPNDSDFLGTLNAIHDTVDVYLKEKHADDYMKPGFKFSIDQFPEDGLVRRECYPWNDFEPDRCSDESLAFLNAEMAKVAPKLEVRATELPVLTTAPGCKQSTVKQLGVFAKESVAPGETVLHESSLMTANNRLQDALCDACSSDLPDLADPAFSDVVDCPDCSAVFCKQECFDLANDQYHPAVCDRGVEDIAKDVPRAEAANSLYTLLLLRALAMAETQELHPLELLYVKYIWGDYHNVDLSKNWVPHNPRKTRSPPPYPRTLPFTFKNNVLLPFNMLEMMDVDIFKNPQYDVWVFNTLYAKFRGTASARLSGLTGPIRGPEVSAVHPMWCLANHSCDPNVSWQWASEIQFKVLEERVEWQGAGAGNTRKTQPGFAKDDEVLNHYCDIELPVKERREWASGALGGDCSCERCLWEANQDAQKEKI